MNKYIILLLLLCSCAEDVEYVKYIQVKGDKGDSCSITQLLNDPLVAPNGGAVITCSDESVMILNGTPGVSPISFVQFCPSVTPTYPSMFPEVGICYNNSLYAVYWDKHNAWLSSIPNGYYKSTSTSAPCNFHVVNCNVSY